MKVFKKLLAALGTAGVFLAAAPAHATLELQFFDGANTLLWSTSQAADELGVGTASNSRMNGWSLNGLQGTRTPNPDFPLAPFTFQLTGNIFKSNLVTNLGAGFTNGQGQVSTAVVACGVCNTLKIRFISTFASPPSQVVNLNDVLTISNVPQLPGSTMGVSLAAFTTGPNANPSMFFGPIIPSSPAPTNFVNQFSFPTGTGANFLLIAGFDLTVPGVGSQDASNGFNFANTVTFFNVVPEPDSLALLGLALLGVVAVRRKRKA